MELSVAVQGDRDFPVLRVSGEVDVYSAPKLQDAITSLLDSGTGAIVLDLTEVSFLDSTGLGVLVAARTAAADAGRALPIACAHERILKLFKITGLEGVFDIYPDLDAAAGSLGHPTPTA